MSVRFMSAGPVLAVVFGAALNLCFVLWVECFSQKVKIFFPYCLY